MDNAGNGRRGLRAASTAEVLAALREHYGIAGSQYRDLGGSSSLNLLVADGPDRYVVRVYRPSVTPSRLADINLVRRQLARGGVPVPQAVPTREGGEWATIGGRRLEVERFVEHDAIMDSWGRLEAGLPLLGRIHTLLQAVQVSAEGRRPLFANHLEPAQARAATARGTARIRGWEPTPAEERLADMADELAELVSAGERDIVAALPRQLVHGGFWHNNVLFRQGRVVLVADLDFMGERARIDDVALVLYFADFGWVHEEADESRRARLRRLVDSYDSGLDQPLTALERAALPECPPTWRGRSASSARSAAGNRLLPEGLVPRPGFDDQARHGVVGDADRPRAVRLSWRYAYCSLRAPAPPAQAPSAM